MKKVCSVLMALLMVLSLIPVSVLASAAETYTEPTIYVESKNAFAGTNVSVNINISNNPGIAGAKLTLTYDSKLTLTNATSGEALSVLDYTKPGVYTTPCSFTWDSESAVADTNGTMLTLDFTISETAEDGEDLPVNITYSTGDFYDIELNDVNFKTVSGVVGIIDYIPGDVNSDNVINGKDVTLLRRYNAGGYGVSINEAAADVNDDNAINGKDITLIRRYNAGGYGVTLLPHSARCQHSLEAFEAKAAKCTEAGNIDYWHCTLCDKYFSDADARAEITLDETVVAAKGHTVVIDEAVPATETSTGLTEGSHCSVCNAVIVKQEIIPILESEKYSITYKYTNNDSYLATQCISNPNPYFYTAGKSLTLKNVEEVPGYTFEGWYDSFSDNANKISVISDSSAEDIVLYAHWSRYSYTVTYKSYDTPMTPITDEKYTKYYINEGISNLPNPEIKNYEFLGWYTEDGKEWTSIPVGTVPETNEEIILNAYYISKRNLTQKVASLDEPVVLHDIDNKVIYYTYEIGSILNVPLSEPVWTIQAVSGLAQQQTVTVTTSISQSTAEAISNTVTKATVDSSTWTLSEDWTDVCSVSEEWAQQHGESATEAFSKTITDSNTISITDGSGGSSSITSNTGTTAVGYDSSNNTSGSTKELNVGVNGKFESSASFGDICSSGFEIGASVDAGYQRQNSTNSHTGTDTTTYNTTTSGSVGSWNSSKTASTTHAESVTNSVSNTISDIVSNKYGYGESYSKGGANSESQAYSSTDSNSVNTASTFTYSTAETETKTSSYSADGRFEGNYRLVVAGTVHVFGIVGYDVATSSFFTYTYSVLDDERHDFLDYSPNSSFNDCEYGVIPFEIPYEVYEDVRALTATTDGVEYKTDTKTKTATVIDYTGSSKDVLIPTYTSIDNTAYTVTEIRSDVFAGKTVENVSLGRYIESIPDSAFKNCVNLKGLSGYFTSIGNNAFCGCINMNMFTISESTTSIGNNAFFNVPEIKVNILSGSSAESLKQSSSNTTNLTALQISQNRFDDIAQDVIDSGALSVIIDISSSLDGLNIKLVVPSMNKFSLVGNTKSTALSDFKIVSDAKVTALSGLTVDECSEIPLWIGSDELILNAVSISSPSYCALVKSDVLTLTLFRDNHFISGCNRAMVCKEVIINSEKIDSSVGLIDVTGNIYNYGSITNQKYIELDGGQINSISEESYNILITGKYNIVLNACEGNVSSTQTSSFYGLPISELPIPTRDNYTFVGWFTGGDTPTRITTSSVLNPESGSVELFAQWTINSRTVTFNANSGNCTESSRVVNNGTAIGTLPVPTRTGYNFAGWFTAASGGEQISASTVINADATYYAHWSVKGYSLNWNGCTGCNITVTRTASPSGQSSRVLSNNETVYYGDVLTISYAAQTNYTVTSHGITSITVTRNITAADIYATTKLNEVYLGCCDSSTNPTGDYESTVQNFRVEFYKIGNQIKIRGYAYDRYNNAAIINYLNVDWCETTAHEGWYAHQNVGCVVPNQSGINMQCDVPAEAQGHMFEYTISDAIPTGARVVVYSYYAGEGKSPKIADTWYLTGDVGLNMN